jgi:hypothetical protein
MITALIFFSVGDALGIFFGIVWGYINFYLIEELATAWFKKNRSNFKFLSILFIKFPLLYWIGYQLLLISVSSPWNLLIGFSIALILCIQKGIKKMQQQEISQP